MARRQRRARFLCYNGPSSPIVSDISLWDHVLLLDMLKSQPQVVLSQFQAVGIWCLVEMESYRRLWVENRSAALTIADVAARMGIPFDAGRPDIAWPGDLQS